MHDCRTINSRLVDLVFDELEADEKLRLLAEVETCDGCLGEYRSITGTLLVFDRAAEASLPEESYWPEHRAMLSQRLAPAVASSPGISRQRRDPLWKRIFTVRLPVPVPVAAVIMLALLVSSVLALRKPASQRATPVQPAAVATAAPSKVIEVPVVREKIVTRTVYVWKKQREKKEQLRSAPTPASEETALTARHTEKASGEGGIFTRANLTGFQPPDELRIRIVKRSNADEN